MSNIILPPGFDPEALLAELEATLQRIKEQPLAPQWEEALAVVREEEQQQCSAEEFAKEMGLL